MRVPVRPAVVGRGVARLLVSGALVLGTACSDSLQTRVLRAMQGCVSARNDAFRRGDGEAALAIPLPAEVDSLATRTAYAFGLTGYQALGDAATTQAELTCALELGSHYDSPDTRTWLEYYTHHPDAPVASLAKRQLAKLRMVKGGAP